MSRSKRRPKPKMPGDGCWHCDAKARVRKYKKQREREANR